VIERDRLPDLLDRVFNVAMSVVGSVGLVWGLYHWRETLRGLTLLLKSRHADAVGRSNVGQLLLGTVGVLLIFGLLLVLVFGGVVACAVMIRMVNSMRHRLVR
jgi:hypothetical protein